ncbi:hypothetical protein AVEN_138285-1 [Araneus ventricosus]|uniref:Uncharacterized protein n=1 Tax=Araneus ventricosus TaxID=182803 RepID=A0A4Y2ITV6_ARAVE|nr:hypothetical protein AVEN_138285-1 [Araneus ventricosus]
MSYVEPPQFTGGRYGYIEISKALKTDKRDKKENEKYFLSLILGQGLLTTKLVWGLKLGKTKMARRMKTAVERGTDNETKTTLSLEILFPKYPQRGVAIP